MEKKKSGGFTGSLGFVMAAAVGAVICLGYNLLYFEVALPGGSTGTLLDIMDYISNSVIIRATLPALSSAGW